LAALDPTRGHEIKKTRPCLVVSPDEMNRNIGTVLVAPMTTKGRPYPTRVPVTFGEQSRQIVLDQLRTVDKKRLLRCLGTVEAETARQVLDVLREMFTE
jgi:mRNA interferase MazF